MARYPAAVWEDVGAPASYSNGVMRSHTGIVLHCNDAQSDDLYGWITGDHDVSCHFQVNKAGKVYQYIDTRYSSWCQRDGNDDYLSIESQGLASEPATDAQVHAVAGILAWAGQVHGIPLRLAEVPGQAGFGWHGMGAANGYDWGHAACPGVRKDQRAEMLTLAQRIGAGGDWFDMADLDDLKTAVRQVLHEAYPASIDPDGTAQSLLDWAANANVRVNDVQSRVRALANVPDNAFKAAQGVAALSDPAKFAAALAPLLPAVSTPQLEDALKAAFAALGAAP
jgi:N-acetylmuramoyl-L-alanine amidase